MANVVTRVQVTRWSPAGVKPSTLRTKQRSAVTFALKRVRSDSNADCKVEKGPLQKIGAFTGAAALVVVLLTASPSPADAASSGGRAGGSSFSRARTERAAPRQSAPAPQVNNYYVAPPVSPFGFSPFGFSPFGGFGYGFGPTIVVGGGGGLGIFGWLISGMLGLWVVSAIASFFSGRNKKQDDEW